MNKKLSKKLSALGLAKLHGFIEWLSIHPIMVEVGGEEITEESSSSHKMLVFAYHHKVLDGVTVFLCEKGIQFVRIDCTVTGNDRQSAIQSFQSSKKVKIALIGIRAGSSGLNLTSADNVVFLELPTNPGDIQQAEDRAHRHGQKRLVNIYIFCAKFIFLTDVDGKIKAWLYDSLGSRVDYDAPGHSCTTMTYGADGTRW